MHGTVERAFEAVRSGDAECLAEMLAGDPALAGARNDYGLSLVLQACYFKRQNIVDLILDASPLLDIFDASALPDQTERAAELLAADPSLAGRFSADGFTPLHLASYFGAEETARLLLARGALPDAVSRNAMSLRPLHSAAAARAMGIVAMLLQRGADVNARQHGGWTALHSAVSQGDFPLVKLLLDHTAAPDIASDLGKTSFDLADEGGHTEIADLLLSHCTRQTRTTADVPSTSR